MTLRRVAACLLVGAGMVVCRWIYPREMKFNPSLPQMAFRVDNDSWAQRILLAVAVALTAWPASRRAIGGTLERLRHPTPAGRRRIAWAIFLLGGPVLYILARLAGRMMLPIWHDECFYRLQTTFLAHGKFCLPPLPLSDFFEVPYVFSRPVFGVPYFPGTALLYVPAAWLHLPYCVMPLLIATTILTLLYLVIGEMLDGLAGLLAVLLMISLGVFRWLALAEMSHTVGAMWGLTVVWSWFCWRRSGHWRWVVLASVAAGWYGITRPLDAVGVLTPVAVAWAWDLRRRTWRDRLIAIGAAFALMAPFLAFQLAFDQAFTGHLLRPPLGEYNRIYFNVRSFGLQHLDPDFLPPSQSVQVLDVYWWGNWNNIKNFTTVKDAVYLWFHDRLPLTFGSALPTLMLMVLFPASLLGWSDARRRVMGAIFWCFLIASSTFYLYHYQYVMAIAAAIIFGVLLSSEVLQKLFPMLPGLRVFLPLAIFLLTAQRICMNYQGKFEKIGSRSAMHMRYLEVPRLVRQPAIVLWRYSSTEEELEEPVYNWEVLSPDQSPITHALDLGEARNVELFHYYAQRQPERNVYLLDRVSKTLTPLGNVKDLDPQHGAPAALSN